MRYQDKVSNTKRTRGVSYRFGSLFSWLKSSLRANRTSLSSRSLLLILLTIVMGGALACQVVWQHVRHTRTRVQLNELQRQNHELKAKIHKKELVVARLERLDRIQRIAVNQLGMKPLDRVPVLEMSQTQWVQSPRKGGEPMVP